MSLVTVRRASQAGYRGHPRRAVAPQPQAERFPEMPDSDVARLNDPDFFAERQRVRELLDGQPPGTVSEELTARYQALNDEFERRAQQAWSAAW